MANLMRRTIFWKKSTLQFTIRLILLYSLCNHSSFALDPNKQISQYGYSVWSRQNGLPANAVNVAIQTHEGYIWLGTSAGLLRFDGVHFEAISTDTSDSKNREVITALCETDDSSLWIGTGYSGLRHLKNGKLLPCGPNEGFPAKPVKALYRGRNGKLWIGSSDGLFVYDKKFTLIPIEPLYTTGIAGDSSGIVFVGTGKGIHYFHENQTDKISGIYLQDGLPNELITAIFADSRGNIWIGTEYGFVLLKNGRISIEKISDNTGLLHITSICEDRHGNIWVGTTQGLFRRSENKWTNFRASQGLQSDNILNIMEDQEGSIWVCTSEGLIRFRDVNLTTYTTQEGLVNNYLTSVIETPDGSMYFLSAANGGSITKLKNSKLLEIPNPPPVGPSFLAKDGSIWTALSGTLCRIKNDKITRYDPSTGLPNRWISAITEDSLGLIIYLDRIGIRRFNDGKVKPYLLAKGQEYSPTDYVSCLYQKLHGPLWIGTSNGLVKIYKGKSTIFTTDSGLVDNWTNSVFEDKKENIWISSPRGGITHYRNGKFIPFNSKIGLFTNEIYCVLVDDNNDVWMSSPRGIGKITNDEIEAYESNKIKAISTQVFTTADGMRTDECFGGWQPSAWKANDGQLWFATGKGIAMIDPKTFKKNMVPPPVYIERIIVDTQSIRLDNILPLSPGKEKLEFHYTALSYLVIDRVYFKYKLEGFDREWVDAGTRRVAYYTNLPYGNYTFRVIACNNDGVWNATGANFKFELLPHFYETSWFIILLLVAFWAIVFGIYRWRVWKLLQKDRELELRIKERTQQLVAANKELESFSYSVSHDLRAPLRSINGFSNALLEDYQEILDEQGKDFLHRVRSASKHMEHLIDDILNLSRVLRSDIKRTSVDLSNLAQSIALDHQQHQPNRQVTFIISPNIVVEADRNLMSIVMENLIDNAWKFTSKRPSSRIEFSYTIKDGRKVYFVRDNGDGFDMKYADKLFGAFQRMHSSSEFTGTGVGLATVLRIINRHGGHIWAEAEKNKGATFYFTIPL